MPFEPVFETINYCKRKGNLTDQIKVECRTEISCEAVSKILNVSALPQITRADAVGGQVKYEGRVTFFIAYEDQDGNVKKCECGSEFTGGIVDDGVTEDCKITAFSKCEKTEVSLSGIKLTAISYLKIDAKISESKKCSAVSGGTDLIVNGKEVSFSRSYGIKTAAFNVEEDFELGYKVAEVISQTSKAVVTAVQCGVGVIIVDGEVYFSAIFLQSNEKRDIIRENKVFPFRMEIECEDAMPAFSASAYVFDKSLKTDIAVDEDGGISQVSVSVTLGFSGEAFSEESATLATDAFSVKENLEIEKESIECCSKGAVRSILNKISGRAGIEEIPVGAYITCVAGERAEIIAFNQSESGVTVSGTLTVNALLCDADGKVFSRKAETPFEMDLECALCNPSELEVYTTCKCAQAKIISLTEIEIEGDLIFSIYPIEKHSLSCIKEVKSAGEKPVPECAISVFIPTANEDLWSLAKRLNVCPDSLIATNKDLQFPLTGKERIVVYRNR